MINKTVKICVITILSLLSSAFFVFAEYKAVVKHHPVEFKTPPICSDCHNDERAVFNHTADYAKQHGFYAAQKEAICEACHATAFCADCHTNKEELKPSDKLKDKPEMEMPHRGDYITQHRIDGRINPAPCFRCHGRRNNERCNECHR